CIRQQLGHGMQIRLLDMATITQGRDKLILEKPQRCTSCHGNTSWLLSYSDARQIACGLLHTCYENLDQAISEHSFYYSRALARLHPILYGYDVVIVPGLSISRPQILTRQGLS